MRWRRRDITTRRSEARTRAPAGAGLWTCDLRRGPWRLRSRPWRPRATRSDLAHPALFGGGGRRWWAPGSLSSSATRLAARTEFWRGLDRAPSGGGPVAGRRGRRGALAALPAGPFRISPAGPPFLTVLPGLRTESPASIPGGPGAGTSQHHLVGFRRSARLSSRFTALARLFFRQATQRRVGGTDSGSWGTRISTSH